jgi:hypothetical protein
MNPEKIYYERMQKIRAQLLKNEIPDAYPEYVTYTEQPLHKRYAVNRFDFINISSFSRVSRRWVEPLARFIQGAGCLEIMAGKGALAKALNDCGVQITATDDFSWKWHRNPENKAGHRAELDELWFGVEEMDCVDAVRKYGIGCGFILCGWPPYRDENLHKSLLSMREVNPECRLIYIGEEKGGCSANDAFFDAARWIEDDKIFNAAAARYQNWQPMRGRIMLTA